VIEMSRTDRPGWTAYESLGDALRAYPCPNDAPEGETMATAREIGSGRVTHRLVRRGMFSWRWEPI
jgi:hypothetical protein